MKRFLLLLGVGLMAFLIIRFRPTPDVRAPEADAAEELRAAVLEAGPEIERKSLAVPATESEAGWMQVSVRTVDARGQPVSGVPVGFGWSAERAHTEILGVTSGADATASMRIPGPQPERHRYVHAILLSSQTVCTELTDATSTEPPVQIVVPAFGVVRIEVASELSMFGQCVLARSEDAVDRFGRSKHALWTEVEERTAEFACVTLGQSLTASLQQRGGRGSITQRFVGP